MAPATKDGTADTSCLEARQALFQEDLARATANPEEMEYFSHIDFAEDCYAAVEARRAYPHDRVLQSWATSGYMGPGGSTSRLRKMRLSKQGLSYMFDAPMGVIGREDVMLGTFIVLVVVK